MSVRRYLVLSGPSGVGKNTLIDEVLSRLPEVKLGASLTTRSPRPGDRPGKYVYVTKEEFAARKHELLESAQYGPHWYGTLPPKDPSHTLLEIDVQGAAQVKRDWPGSTLVFVVPPGGTKDEQVQVLRSRLVERHTDSTETIETRLREADREISIGTDQSDYVVVNDSLEQAVQQVEAIIREWMKS